MKLIIGLGNPGEKYKGTRHNVGFVVLDRIAQELGIKNYELSKKFQSLIANNQKLILAKPQTFMNNSGVAVASLYSYFKIHNSDLYIVHDDLDLRLGDYKIQKGVGPKLHYGIQSIENSIGSKDFLRVRIGVDNRDPENRTSGEQYVLQEFTKEERKAVDKTIEDVVNDLLEHYLQ